MATGSGASKAVCWDARIDDEALVSTPFPDGEDTSDNALLFSELDHTILEKSSQKLPFSRTALAHTRVDVPFSTGHCSAEPLPALPLAAILHCAAGQCSERSWDPPTHQGTLAENVGLAGPERERAVERSALVYLCNLEQPEAPTGLPGRRSRMSHSTDHGFERTRLCQSDWEDFGQGLTALRQRIQSIYHLVLHGNTMVTALKPALSRAAKSSMFIAPKECEARATNHVRRGAPSSRVRLLQIMMKRGKSAHVQ